MTSKGDVLLAGRIAGDDVTVAIDAEGDIVMPGIVTTHGTVELQSRGAVVQMQDAGILGASLLTVTSAVGQRLVGDYNSVLQFRSVNLGSGGVLLRNSASVLDVTGIAQVRGEIGIE